MEIDYKKILGYQSGDIIQFKSWEEILKTNDRNYIDSDGGIVLYNQSACEYSYFNKEMRVYCNTLAFVQGIHMEIFDGNPVYKIFIDSHLSSNWDFYADMFNGPAILAKEDWI